MTNSVVARIENELKNLFDSLNRKWVKVSFILSKLELPIKIEQRKSIFTPESLIKLHLWKRIKGINFHNKALMILNQNQEDALNLGFYKDAENRLQLPTKQAFNKFLKNKIGKENLSLLEPIVALILKTATHQGVLLDLEIVEKVINKKNNAKEEKRALKEAVRLIKKLIYPQVEIKIKENGKFTIKDLLNVLVHVAYSHDFTHDGSVTFQELNPDSKCPSSWTMLYHFNKFRSIDQVKQMFEKIFSIIFNFSKKNYNLLNRRKLDIAIDTHKIPYYGDKSDQWVTESKHEFGTTHFYQFLTSAIVVAGRRFTLDVIPIHKLDNLEDLVNEIITKAKEKISIDKVYLDRGFDKSKVINVLKANKVKFVMPKIRSKTVKEWFEKSIDCKSRIIENFEIGKKEKALVNLVLIDDEDGIKRAFITNFRIQEQLAHYLYEWYGKRWGIETGYRQIDNDFKAKTTSKNYCIRLFYFLFSVCLYNLWVLVNICISLTLYGRIKDKPIITSKLFTIVLYLAEYENPGGEMT
ncbi:hypothetical protein HY498_01450 [Candidatus Woesearchaeota archaeon]|nr:hypothetical protein [Candidatus Woesearchaeota archaeon]